MQVSTTAATLAGDATISTDGEFVTFNGHLLTAGNARAISNALIAAATHAESRKERRQDAYKRGTIAHALQMLASVQ